ncbi:MAG: YceI family protein [Alphaproteobacteria bacterium]|nr:YceI family protein [Alphaproteobacteria bacterium]
MFVALLASLTLPACVADVAKDKVEATVEEAKTEAPAPAKGTTWAVDRDQSTLKALGAKVTATHPIVFNDWKGSVKVDGDDVTSIEFVVQMDSLEADHPKLTSHLKDEDFFDVPNHPTATFVSTSIEPGGEGQATHTVTGNLTIRGNTKSVTFPAIVAKTGDAVTASTEFSIDRQDFKVSYPGRADDLVQDNVLLTIAFVARP